MKTMRTHLMAVIIVSAYSVSCYSQPNNSPELKTSIEVMDPAMNALVNKDAKVEIIADGLDWSEGPLWVESEKMLLFSDVPKNIVYKWTQAKGKETYLTPSGYTGTIPRGGELGSNGLGLNNKNQLVLCQDGDRKVSIMDAPLSKPKAKFITLADNYNGKKFDSPNDIAFLPNGDIYFTDPPYGLERNVKDPLKEAPYQGVYRIAKNGKVTLLTDSITRPNGIGFLPGNKTLIIANSDPGKPVWYAYDLDSKGLLSKGRIFYDAREAARTSRGAPDGLKVDKQGNIFAAGPGGLWIFDKTGKLLGKIRANVLVSNCSLSADQKTVYITADMYILKVKMR